MLYLPMLLIQVIFAVHAYRTGRPFFWIYIILIFPGVGALIYILAEVLPEYIHGPGTKAAQKFKKALDPDKELRAAKFAAENAPTIANRVNLAQLLMAKHDYDGVITQLQPALASQFADDPQLLEGLAYAYFHKGDYTQATHYVQQIYDHKDWRPKDYIKLLHARLLQATGKLDDARAEMTELVKTFSGEEARITLAQICEQQGAKDEARSIYNDILTRARHAPKHYRTQQSEWIDAAKAAIRKL